MDKKLYQYIVNKEHHTFRKDFPQYANLAEEFAAQGAEPQGAYDKAL